MLSGEAEVEYVGLDVAALDEGYADYTAINDVRFAPLYSWIKERHPVSGPADGD